MSRLLSRILLAILMLPLATIVYIVVFFPITFVRGWTYSAWYNPFAGLATWAFVAVYWSLLWRHTVRWTQQRIQNTFVAAIVVTLAGLAIYAFLAMLLRERFSEFASFVGSATTPLLWLVATVWIWRESADERAARVKSTHKDAIVCPACGYNLTGLTESRCPECGARYTLDELYASQPKQDALEIEAAAS